MRKIFLKKFSRSNLRGQGLNPIACKIEFFQREDLIVLNLTTSYSPVLHYSVWYAIVAGRAVIRSSASISFCGGSVTVEAKEVVGLMLPLRG